MKQFTKQNPVAYFSAEFGVDSLLPIYAGGLGVLAGDILKEASDLQVHMVGIGLLYKGEEAKQMITTEGNQVEANIDYQPEEKGLTLVKDVTGQVLYLKVHLTQVDVWLQVWEKKIGETVSLYLLDPDNPLNHSHERRQAWAIYAGTQEEIIKQQLILGIGGVKALDAMKITPALYHVNEGRPSFLYWQLIRQMMDKQGLSYKQAVIQAKKMIVYTNHTVVKAGNQTYDLDLMKAYTKYYSQKMGVTVDHLLKDGTDKQGRFDVTQFALNISSKASAVSAPHYQICLKNWPKYNWYQATNGVHFPTWVDMRLQDENLTDEQLWQYHQENKIKTQKLVYERTGFSYDPHSLVITWARRFATYKQPGLIFKDIEKIRQILLSTARPVQLLMAGKAHVFDLQAKKIIRELIGYMSQELRNHALFIPNHNMELGAALTRGSDVWLNTPIVGEEASATSGMKAIANGVLHLSTVDGWVAEVDWSDESTGWTLASKNTGADFYQVMNEKVIPTFYQRNEQDLPVKWMGMMRKSIQLARNYSATRMMEDYSAQLY